MLFYGFPILISGLAFTINETFDKILLDFLLPASVAKTEMPDVILIDIVMPDLNGFQATRQLSKHDATKNIPVIVVSTKSEQTDRIWAMRQGECEYLTKPVDESALVHAVNAVLVS